MNKKINVYTNWVAYAHNFVNLPSGDTTGTLNERYPPDF